MPQRTRRREQQAQACLIPTPEEVSCAPITESNAANQDAVLDGTPEAVSDTPTLDAFEMVSSEDVYRPTFDMQADAATAQAPSTRRQPGDEGPLQSERLPATGTENQHGARQPLDIALDAINIADDAETLTTLARGAAPGGGNLFGAAVAGLEGGRAIRSIHDHGANPENVTDLVQAGVGACGSTPTPAAPYCAAAAAGYDVGERYDQVVEEASGQSYSDRMAESLQVLTTGRAPEATHRGIRPEDEQNPCAFPSGSPERRGVPDDACDRQEPRLRDAWIQAGIVEDTWDRMTN